MAQSKTHHEGEHVGEFIVFLQEPRQGKERLGYFYCQRRLLSDAYVLLHYFLEPELGHAQWPVNWCQPFLVVLILQLPLSDFLLLRRVGGLQFHLQIKFE